MADEKTIKREIRRVGLTEHEAKVAGILHLWNMTQKEGTPEDVALELADATIAGLLARQGALYKQLREVRDELQNAVKEESVFFIMGGEGFMKVTDREEVKDWLEMDPEIWQGIDYPAVQRAIKIAARRDEK